jgi:hypothetical protein
MTSGSRPPDVTTTAVVPPGRPARLFAVAATSDRLIVIDSSGQSVASTNSAAIAAVQAAAVAVETGTAYVSDSADRCIQITRTPAGFTIAGARDTRWAGTVATVLSKHGGATT